MKERIILFLLLGIDALLLTYQTSQLSISYYETLILYKESSFLHHITNFSLSIFGQNDFALRLPMIVMHLLSVILLYSVSKTYVAQFKDRLWVVFIFIMLPGVISSSLVVNGAGVIILSLLLTLFFYQRFSLKSLYLLLTILLFLDSDFIYLFFSLIIYSIYIKDKIFFVFNLFLLIVSVYMFGHCIDGVPKGHFIDLIGIYSAVFTPVIFVYIVYVLYRRGLKKEIDLLWFIGSVTLVVSLVLSFRQRIYIESFAPYLIVTIPLVAQTFIHSYRVRLQQFRRGYKLIFRLSLIFLILNSVVVFFNKELYMVIEKPHKHFAYDMDIAKELANKLKSNGIHCVKTDDRMSDRLKFYGISFCEEYNLTQGIKHSSKYQNVTVGYKNKVIYSGYVTKINK